MESWILWLIVTAVLILIELFTGMIATFCLAFGCLLAMVMTLFGCGIEWQLGALAVGTVIAFIAFAPLIRRLQSRRGKAAAEVSNMDALKGRVAEVVEIIPSDGGCGRVRIDGDRWQARSVDGVAFSVGDKVRVVGYDSIILDVESIS
ncbi:MAG: NfeD family protein [Muribaculaceae bacterium]|nr:NfeD family protein [Muribaculaceae bacterium]